MNGDGSLQARRLALLVGRVDVLSVVWIHFGIRMKNFHRLYLNLLNYITQSNTSTESMVIVVVDHRVKPRTVLDSVALRS